MKRKPVDAVHVAPTLLGCVLHCLQRLLLQLLSRTVFFRDRKALGPVDFIRSDVLLKKADLARPRRMAVMLVEGGDNFLQISKN